MTNTPIVEFVRMIPNARPPKRADRSAAGYIPTRALRYCDALTSATGYGYWVFPPTDIKLLWDGEEVFWTYDGEEDWMPLTGTDSCAVQFPNYEAQFDADAPDYLRGYSPPFLSAMPELGGVQMWSGLLVRTRPGWSLSVRPPVNLPVIPGLAAWEGIVETDIWFGPLFTNMRITRTDMPVLLRASTPYLQVQPIPQAAYSDATLGSYGCSEASTLRAEDWADLGKILLPSADHEARQGLYAVTVRKRRSCPAALPAVPVAITDEPDTDPA